MKFGQKRSTFKIVNKECIVVKEISIIKKKSSSLHQDNRKDVLRASQELVGVYPSQDQGYKG
jgi:hypothetical protein